SAPAGSAPSPLASARCRSSPSSTWGPHSDVGCGNRQAERGFTATVAIHASKKSGMTRARSSRTRRPLRRGRLELRLGPLTAPVDAGHHGTHGAAEQIGRVLVGALLEPDEQERVAIGDGHALDDVRELPPDDARLERDVALLAVLARERAEHAALDAGAA